MMNQNWKNIIFSITYPIAYVFSLFFLFLVFIELIRPGFSISFFQSHIIAIIAVSFCIISFVSYLPIKGVIVPFGLKKYVKLLMILVCSYGVFFVLNRFGGLYDSIIPFIFGAVFFFIACFDYSEWS